MIRFRLQLQRSCSAKQTKRQRGESECVRVYRMTVQFCRGARLRLHFGCYCQIARVASRIVEDSSCPTASGDLDDRETTNLERIVTRNE